MGMCKETLPIPSTCDFFAHFGGSIFDAEYKYTQGSMWWRIPYVKFRKFL